MKGQEMMIAGLMKQFGLDPQVIFGQVQDMAGMITAMKHAQDRIETQQAAHGAQLARIEGKQDLILALLQKEQTNA